MNLREVVTAETRPEVVKLGADGHLSLQELLAQVEQAIARLGSGMEKPLVVRHW